MRASSLCSSIVFLLAVRVRSSLENSRSASALVTGAPAPTLCGHLLWRFGEQQTAPQSGHALLTQA